MTTIATQGILDGTTVVDVLAWAAGGTAQTVIVVGGTAVRVHPARVQTNDYLVRHAVPCTACGVLTDVRVCPTCE